MPFPTARMRVERRLLEIGPDDLALSRAEASRLLADAGVELSDARTSQSRPGRPRAGLRRSTWRPWRIRAGEVTADRPFTGTERLMSDYLHSEVLEPPHPVTAEVPHPYVDPGPGERAAGRCRGGWQRCDPAARAAAAQERAWCCPSTVRASGTATTASSVRRSRPSSEPSRPTWSRSCTHAPRPGSRAHDEPEQAIDHAYLAGDAGWFGRLVLEAMQQVWASGGIDTVERWMERLGSRSPAPHTPAMIAHGALIFALLGRPGDTERWAAVAESLPAIGNAARRRARSRARWPTCARTCAVAARSPCAMTPVRRWPGSGRPVPIEPRCSTREGLSYLLEGDLDRADASFAHAYDLAASIETSPRDRSRPRRAVPGRRRAGRLDRCRVADQASARRSWLVVRSTTTGPAPWCSPPPLATPRIGETCPRLASTRGAPHACDRCSPTPCPSSRSRRWSSWRAPTWRWSTRPGPAPCSSRSTASCSSGPTSAPSRPPPTGWTSGSARSPPPRRSAPRR